jgi:5-methylcytosine-specific restriction protein A
VQRQRRNPPWQRDELILALDLYVTHGGKYLGDDHPRIMELSDVLNGLPIHTDRPDRETFRNPNGASMKLLIFRRFDENQAGTGLTRGNRLEKEVWEQYSGSPDLLHQSAAAIRAGCRRPRVPPSVAKMTRKKASPTPPAA